MTTVSRAAVFHAPGTSLELRDVPLPRLAEGETLVRVSLCTLCGSDLSTYRGKRSTPVPTILGHEILGEVVEIGGGAAKHDLRGEVVAVGDRITWSIAAHCGGCFACTHDMPQKCERLFKYGHERMNDAHPLSGGLAEYCHLTADTPVLRLPAGLPDAAACFANCATATVAGGLRVGEFRPGESVLILGAGMLGLNAAAMARMAGAGEVIVADVAAERLATAERFGATSVLLFADDGAGFAAEVRERTSKRGADLAIDVSGAPAAMEASLAAVRTGGRVVLVGAVSPTRPLSVDAESVVRRLLTIRGLHNYGPEDLVAAIDFLAQGVAKFPLAELIGTQFELKRVEEAFQEALTGRSLRVAVRP
jgi:putative phosphonate catabolism associated alcohol dehydrogenase